MVTPIYNSDPTPADHCIVQNKYDVLVHGRKRLLVTLVAFWVEEKCDFTIKEMDEELKRAVLRTAGLDASLLEDGTYEEIMVREAQTAFMHHQKAFFEAVGRLLEFLLEPFWGSWG